MFKSADPDKTGAAAGRARRGFFRDRSGVAAIEMALVLPVFLMIVFGIIEFGRALKTWNEVDHALGRAVRLINLDANTTPEQIVTAMTAYLDGVNTDSLSVVATQTNISGTDYIKISVGFPFELILPFSSISTVNINVDRIAPVLSATK